MKRVFCALAFLLLAGAAPAALHAQVVSGGQQPAASNGPVQLGQNYPNPFNPVTRIPFHLSESLFERSEPVVVTIRIYNVLHQLVAIPKALDHPAGNGVLVDKLEYLTPGDKVAFWDGYDRSNRKVASGLYYAQLTVNGYKPIVIKMLVAK